MAGRVALTALRLSHFRNYTAAQLRTAGRSVVLYGDNGAGKTNVLEAVSCLAPGRGLRRATVEEMAERGEGAGPWVVSADVDGPLGPLRVGVGQDPQSPARRMARIDGAAASQSALAEVMRVTWLTPAQDRVFAGPRSERMRFFDRLTLAQTSDHGTAANRYEKALRQRTRVLEEGRGDPAWLEGLEQQMAEAGARMAHARVTMADALAEAINARPDGAFPKADVSVAGWIEERIRDGVDEAAVAQAFAGHLAQERRRDARAGRALDGPHRTELFARHRAKDMPAAECSTGEQKALLVGLILAHARALSARGAAAPLILLDEAVAHLDSSRRAALAQELADLDAQAWLTGTDLALFKDFQDMAAVFCVEDGRVCPLAEGADTAHE